MTEKETLTRFQNVENYEEGSKNLIIENYKKLLTENGLSTENFKLFAISNEHKTYLLPEFHELNPTSKVLILFHEKLMRRYFEMERKRVSYAEALKNILIIDSGVYALTQGDGSKIMDMANAYSNLFQIPGYYGRLNSVVLLRDYEKNWLDMDFERSKVLFEFNGYLAHKVQDKDFFRLDAFIFKDMLLNQKRNINPTENDTYVDIDFWNLFNQSYPELSAILQKNKLVYKNLQMVVKPASDTYHFSLKEPKELHDLDKKAETVCLNETRDAIFATQLVGRDLSPILLFCSKKKVQLLELNIGEL